MVTDNSMLSKEPITSQLQSAFTPLSKQIDYSQFSFLPSTEMAKFQSDIYATERGSQILWNKMTPQQRQEQGNINSLWDAETQKIIDRYTTINSLYQLRNQITSETQELYTGYQSEMQSFVDEKITLIQQSSNLADTASLYSRAMQANTLTPKWYELISPLGTLAGILREQGHAGKMGYDEAKAGYNEAVTALANATTTDSKSDFYLYLYQYAPILIYSGTVSSAADLMEIDSIKQAAAGLGITATDPVVKHLMDSLLGASSVATVTDSNGNEVPVVGNTNLSYDELIDSLTMDESNKMVIPVSMNQLSEAEIMQSLAKEQSEFTTMDTATANAALELLKNGGVDEETASDMTDISSIASQLDADMTALRQHYDNVKAGLESATIPDMTAWQTLKFIVTAPAGAVMDLFHDINKYFFAPLAGWEYRTFRGSVLPGSTSYEDSGFQEIYNRERASGQNWWLAGGTAYDDSGIGWVNRVLYSGFGDPTNYIGFGIIGKAGKSLSIVEKIPVIGKYLRPISKIGSAVNIAERGYVEFWDALIFDRISDAGRLLRAGANKVPVLGSIVAAPFRQLPYQIAAKEAASDMVSVSSALNRAAKRFFWKIPVDDAVKILRECRDYALHNPGDTTSFTARAGRAVIRTAELDEVATRELASRLGSKLTISKETIISVNDVMGRTGLFGGEQLTKDAGAATLLRALGVDDSEAMLKLARKEIDRWLTNGTKVSEDIFSSSKSTADLLTRVFRNTNDAVNKTLEAAAAHNLSMTGRLSSMLSRNSWRAMNIQRLVIDRWVVTPMARSYLVFASYGWSNVMEGFMKPSLASYAPINPFWWFGKENPIMRMQEATDGLGIMSSLRTSMPVSGMAADVPTLGDILTSSKALKTWRAVSSGGVLAKWFVDIPGRIGAYQRANYYFRLYYRHLAETSPEIFSSVVREVKSTLDGMPKDFFSTLKISRSQLEGQLIDKATGGINNVNNLLNDIVSTRLLKPGQSIDKVLSDQISANVLEDVVARHPNVFSAIGSNLIVSARDGSLFAKGLDGLKTRFSDDVAAIYDAVIHRPEVLQARVDDALGKIMSTNPQTKVELLQKLSDIQNVRSMIGEASSDSIRAARELEMKVRKQLSYVEWQKFRSNYLKDVYEKVASYADASTRKFDEIIKNIQDDISKASAPKSTEPAAGAVYDDFMSGFKDNISKFRNQIFLLDNQELASKLNEAVDLLAELTTKKTPDYAEVIQRVEMFAEYIKYQAIPTELSKADRNMSERLANMLWDTKLNSPIGIAARDMIVAISHSDTKELSRIAKEMISLMKTDARFSKYFVTSTGSITTAEADSALRAVQAWLKETSFTQKFVADRREAELAMLRNKPKGKEEISKFWDEYFNSQQIAWNQWREQVAYMLKDSINASDDLSTVFGVHSQKPPVVDASGRKLTKTDVATIFNSRPDALPASLIHFDTMMLKDRIHFTAEVMSQAERMAARIGKTADSLGFTADSIGAVYDSCLRDMYIDPKVASVAEPMLAELRDMYNEVAYVYHSKGVPAGTADKIQKMVETLSDRLKSIDGYDSEAWHLQKQEAADRATKEYVHDWANYDDQNALTATMRMFFPFYTYETHRLAWLPRTMLRKPAVFKAWGTYMDNTDKGYVHIPGTSLELNPLRGTIFMGGMTKLMKYDYPSYYDQFPGMSDVFDGLSRYGFYPAAWLQLLKIVGGTSSGGSLSWGEIIPSWVKTPLDLLVAADPDNNIAKAIQNTLLAEPYRNYTTIMLANKFCQNEQLDFTGEEIWEKMKQGIALTPAEQDVWNRSVQSNGMYQALLEQTGMMRLRTQEKMDFQKQVRELYKQFTGYTDDQLDWLQQHGYRISDYVVLSPLQQQVISQLDGYRYQSGSSLSLMPSSWQDADIKRNEFWREVDNLRDTINANSTITLSTGETIVGQEALDQQWRDGRINGKQWAEGKSRLDTMFANGFTTLANTDEYASVPITMEDILDADGNIIREGMLTLMSKRGIVPTVESPARELLNLYYTIKPETIYDTESDTSKVDWDGYYLRIGALLDALSADNQQEMIQMITRNMTPMEYQLYLVSRQYFQAYNARYRAVMTQFTPEEQIIINSYASDSPADRALAREILRPDGTKLIAQYQSMLRTMGQNLRKMSPDLDAWLRVFGRVENTLTDQAQALYEQHCSELGVPD